MVQAVLTPAHSHSLAALLDEPLPRTLDHATPHRQAQVFVLRLVAMIPVPLLVRLQRRHRIPGGVRPALACQGLAHVGQAPVWLAMPHPVPGPATPPTRPGGAAVEAASTDTARRGKSPGCPGMAAKRSSYSRHKPRAPSLSQTTWGAVRMPGARSSHTRGLSASLSPKTATRRRWRSRGMTLPGRGRCWPKRATPPPLTACHRGFPGGGPPVGRNGPSTPAAPQTKGRRPARPPAPAGRSPCASACQCFWRVSIAWCPAACPP